MQQADLALNYVCNTGYHVFLTGKAGTGKTTFLRNLQGLCPKRMVVIAPTGVAAINAAGMTAHSFFQLPFGPYLPANGSDLSENRNPAFNHKFSKDKINVIKSMDLLVIDEISMVRADLLDAISDVLRRFRDKSKPFGGVQLLLIGDLQQLSPVAKEDEWNLLKEHYNSPYFFDSKALLDSNYLCVELTHVYRQSDDHFISLLNKIRDNQPDEETLRLLNKRCIPDFKPDDKEGYITLTTHNYQAQHINSRKLSELPGKSFTFEAEINGDFPAYSYPTDEKLELKSGAQVMFVKNDSSPEKLYYNGKIGRIISIDEQNIVVKDDTGEDITVGREIWQNTKYTIDEKTQGIKETVIGSFTQYPLKTAWAITIHKSQGLTFERAVIDAAQSFSHGQVYVALSRCRTLEGMVLSRPLTRNALVSDHRVEKYTSVLPEIQAKEDNLREAERQYFLRLVTELFDFEPVQHSLNAAAYTVLSHLSKLYPAGSSSFATSRDQFRTDITEIGTRFQQQLKRLIAESPDYAHDEQINDRICKGTAYFLSHIEPYNTAIVAVSALDTDNKEAQKLLTKAISTLKEAILVKTAVLRASTEGFTVPAYLTAKATALITDPVAAKSKRTAARSPRPEKTDSPESSTPSSDVRHPELFAAIRNWRYELSMQKEVPPYVILQQKALIGISNLLPRDEKQLLQIPGIGKKVMELYGEDLLSLIDDYLMRTKEAE